MTTRSGSGNSTREDMHGASFCVEIENLGCHIFEAPVSHGSNTIVKAFDDGPGEGGNGRIGSKVRRKEASAFRCLTVKDIFELLNDAVEEGCQRHSIQITLRCPEVGEKT